MEYCDGVMAVWGSEESPWSRLSVLHRYFVRRFPWEKSSSRPVSQPAAPQSGREDDRSLLKHSYHFSGTVLLRNVNIEEKSFDLQVPIYLLSSSITLRLHSSLRQLFNCWTDSDSKDSLLSPVTCKVWLKLNRFTPPAQHYQLNTENSTQKNTVKWSQWESDNIVHRITIFLWSQGIIVGIFFSIPQ